MQNNCIVITAPELSKIVYIHRQDADINNPEIKEYLNAGNWLHPVKHLNKHVDVRAAIMFAQL